MQANAVTYARARTLRVGLLTGLVLLAACGGGGGGGSSPVAAPPPPPPPAPAPAPVPPRITQAPQTVPLSLGETAVFVVNATGSGPLSYQWLRDGEPIAGEVRRRLEVRVTDPAAPPLFAVRVTDANGSVTSSGARYTLRADTNWQRWTTAAAGPTLSILIDAPGQFHDPRLLSQGPDLFIVGHDMPAGARRLVTQGLWEPVAVVNDWLQGTRPEIADQAGPARVLVYATANRLWRVDLRVLPGEQPSPRLLSTVATGSLCYDPRLLQDRVDPLRSVLIYRRPGADQRCGTEDDTRALLRLALQPFEDPVELSSVAEELWPVHATSGVLTGLLARDRDGQVLRLDTPQFEPRQAFVPATPGGQTLVPPEPDQPWWVYTDGARIQSVNVREALPLSPQTLFNATASGTSGGSGTTLPQSRGLARIAGQVAWLGWNPADRSLSACAVAGCPSGPRTLVGAGEGFFDATRVPDLDVGLRAWLSLSTLEAGASATTTRVFEVGADGTLLQRLSVLNNPEVRPIDRYLLAGPWLTSGTVGGEVFGLPTDGLQGERSLSPVGTYLRHAAAARAGRFWFYGSGLDTLQLRGADGELLRQVPDAVPIPITVGAADLQPEQDEWIVVRKAAGATEFQGGLLLGLDPLSGEVRTTYGTLPDDASSALRLVSAVRDGQIAHLVLPRNVSVGRDELWTIRVGQPGLRRDVQVGP